MKENKGLRYLTAKDDPVLARIWDNEEDAIYDEIDEEKEDEAMFKLSMEALKDEW